MIYPGEVSQGSGFHFEGKSGALSFIIIMLILIPPFLLSGCIDDNKNSDDNTLVIDTDGDGIPDDIDEFPQQPDYNFTITFLDDTKKENNSYTCSVLMSGDCAVILLRNTGLKDCNVILEAESAAQAWKVSFQTSNISLPVSAVVPVVIFFNLSLSAKPQCAIKIKGTPVQNPNFSAEMILVCYLDTDNTGAAMPGDMVYVKYALYDENYTLIEDGGQLPLPVTAGQDPRYIDGFSLGVLGMYRAPSAIRLGEIKRIRVPPELAYGTDPNSSSGLGGKTLIFELTRVNMREVP
ncbi:MAG: FKBP-type peptidyl-prolyl cis-trans isomerase [Thermoplasmata archaeon]